MMKKYTVQEGKQASRPLVWPLPRFGRPIALWRLQLGNGWSYQLPRNRTQWVKLCGETFNPIRRDKNAIMLAARHTVEGGREITPYYNINGLDYYPESRDVPPELARTWPVLKVDTYTDILYGFTEDDDIVTVTIIYKGETTVHRMVHDGIGCLRFEVGFFFGGSEPAVTDIDVLKERQTIIEYDESGVITP